MRAGTSNVRRLLVRGNEMVTSSPILSLICVTLIGDLGPTVSATERNASVRILIVDEKYTLPDPLFLIGLTPNGDLRDIHGHLIDDEKIISAMRSHGRVEQKAFHVLIVLRQAENTTLQTFVRGLARVKRSADAPGTTE